MAHKPILRRKHQIGGVFFSLLGGGGTVWGWYTPLSDYCNLLFPSLFIMGLGLILIPYEQKEKRIKDIEDTFSRLSHIMQSLTPQWRVILVVAVLAGIVNDALLLLRAGAGLIEALQVFLVFVLFCLCWTLRYFIKNFRAKNRHKIHNIRQ